MSKRRPWHQHDRLPGPSLSRRALVTVRCAGDHDVDLLEWPVARYSAKRMTREERALLLGIAAQLQPLRATINDGELRFLDEPLWPQLPAAPTAPQVAHLGLLLHIGRGDGDEMVIELAPLGRAVAQILLIK